MERLITVDRDALTAMRTAPMLVWRDDAVFEVRGAGAVACLQGLLTNDVVRAGEQGLVWGAFLTPKGMIITDAWVMRDSPEALRVIVPATARETVRTLMQRTIPPRLAKWQELDATVRVGWILGGDAAAVPTARAPSATAPFTAMVVTADPAATEAAAVASGHRIGPAVAGEVHKLLLGWPTLGREIDDRTLVQEVRFDELDGVRYDKGCFTGQETVARLHFRGHPNRTLRGLAWGDGASPSDMTVVREEKSVGSIGTVANLGGKIVALALVRREIEDGSELIAGGARARVVALPFGAEMLGG